MFYCFISPQDIEAGLISVTGENFNHLKTVLHASAGEMIRVRSDRFIYEARIETIGKDRILARIFSSKETDAGHTPKLILAPALIQEKNFDLLLQQSVQLGISSILPILTKNVANHRMKPDRKERWQKIVKAACMQSQRKEIPEVHEPAEFTSVVEDYLGRKDIRMVMPYELEQTRIIDAPLFEGVLETVVFIGPEGGWSVDEATFARKHGVITVSLGGNILRAETAALVSLTLVSRCLGIL